jgi:nitrogen fixation NifU-like protein
MDKELIEELYQSLILDHSRKPRNFGDLPNCTCCQSGKNPACGDQLKLCIKTNTHEIEDIKFTGEGCALMTQLIKGKNIALATTILSEFIDFVLDDDIVLSEAYEPLHIFETVKNFPLRVKCVLLPWRTLEHMLTNPTTNLVSTE